MTDNMTLQILAIPVALFLGYALLAVVAVVRRGLRGREAIMFVGYLVDASIRILETPEG